MGRRGVALLITLVALLSVGLALTLFHRHALDVRRLARAALASARAREAAGVGIGVRAAGLGASGVLAGGATWLVREDTLLTGVRLLWSQGSATLPALAQLEVAAILVPPDSAHGTSGGPLLPQRWVVLRY